MSPRSHARPAQRREEDGADPGPSHARDHAGEGDQVPTSGPQRSRGWRPRSGWTIGTPLVVLLCGSLFAVSAANSEGTDLRPGRYTDLASLVRTESEEYERLQDRVAELNKEVASLSEAVGDRDVSRYRRRISQMRDPAGLTPVRGDAVTVTLTDSDPDLADSASEGVDLNLFLVHQQDIQAVVNAMWAGGAEAVTVQGKRIVSTTGIKCIGNSVMLQGRPYSPPYVITAVGDQGSVLESVMSDDDLAEYRRQSQDPQIGIGWDLDVEEDVTAPAYDGLLDLTYARPLR